jgi:hypothetical protein
MSFLPKCVKKRVGYWMFDAGDAERLRTRARRMLELANRAYCEKNYDFARLLTLLATEAFEHASDMEQQMHDEDRIAAR